MVLSRGPLRFTGIIINRTNTEGGPKKAGLSRHIGIPSTILPAYREGVNTLYGLKYKKPNYYSPAQVAVRQALRGLHGLH
jgi:hypothetical protein